MGDYCEKWEDLCQHLDKILLILTRLLIIYSFFQNFHKILQTLLSFFSQDLLIFLWQCLQKSRKSFKIKTHKVLTRSSACVARFPSIQHPQNDITNFPNCDTMPPHYSLTCLTHFSIKLPLAFTIININLLYVEKRAKITSHISTIDRHGSLISPEATLKRKKPLVQKKRVIQSNTKQTLWIISVFPRG